MLTIVAGTIPTVDEDREPVVSQGAAAADIMLLASGHARGHLVLRRAYRTAEASAAAAAAMLDDQEATLHLGTSVRSLALSARGILAAGCESGRVLLFGVSFECSNGDDLASCELRWQPLCRLPRPSPEQPVAEVEALALSSSSRWLAVGGSNGLRVWELVCSDPLPQAWCLDCGETDYRQDDVEGGDEVEVVGEDEEDDADERHEQHETARDVRRLRPATGWPALDSHSDNALLVFGSACYTVALREERREEGGGDPVVADEKRDDCGARLLILAGYADGRVVLLSLSRGSRGAESTLVILWREQRCGPIQAVALSERDLVVAAADHNTASTATENATEADAESLKENSRPAIPDGRAALGSNRNSAQVGPSWGPASASSSGTAALLVRTRMARIADSPADAPAAASDADERSWASGISRDLELPSSRSADCDNASCDPPGVQWNGQWQAPTTECPVCSTSFPVVNACALILAQPVVPERCGCDDDACALDGAEVGSERPHEAERGCSSKVERVTLVFGGYGRMLHAWEL